MPAPISNGKVGYDITSHTLQLCNYKLGNYPFFLTYLGNSSLGESRKGMSDSPSGTYSRQVTQPNVPQPKTKSSRNFATFKLFHIIATVDQLTAKIKPQIMSYSLFIILKYKYKGYITRLYLHWRFCATFFTLQRIEADIKCLQAINNIATRDVRPCRLHFLYKL